MKTLTNYCCVAICYVSCLYGKVAMKAIEGSFDYIIFECSNGWSVVSVFVSKGLNLFVSVPERILFLTSRKFIDVSFLYLDPLQIILRGLLF